MFDVAPSTANCWYVPASTLIWLDWAQTMILGCIMSVSPDVRLVFGKQNCSVDLFRLCLFQRSQCGFDFFGVRYSPNPTSFGTTSPNLLTNQVSSNLAWSKAEPSLCSGVVIKIF